MKNFIEKNLKTTNCDTCGNCKNSKSKSFSTEELESLYEELTENEKGILDWKAGEYAPSGDQLQNFREIADFIGPDPVQVTPALVTFMYLMKHVQSIKNAVISGEYNWAWITDEGEGTKQRIADIRNYMLLLAACLQEQNKAKAEKL